MKTKEFLKLISDEQGPLQTTAADVIERMSKQDFNELCQDMKYLSAETWQERHQAKGSEQIKKVTSECAESLFGKGEPFHPTNKESH